MAKKNTKRKRIIWGVIILVVIAVAISAMLMGKRDNALAVTVEKVSRRTITQTVTATGKIQPENLVKISSEASGEIIVLTVKEGDTVRKGQLLVRIKPDLVQTQLEQAQAAAQSVKANINTAKAELDRQKAEFDRIKGLYDKQFASKGDLDAVTAAYNSAQARYEGAVKDYERSNAAVKQSSFSAERTAIYAPIDGIVVALPVKLGEKVVGVAQMQGTELMQIADLGIMNAEVDVDENDVVLISHGDTVRVTVDAFPEKIFRGYVYQIGNSAKRGAAGTQEEIVNFTIKARLVDTDVRFRPGMSCDVDIETDTHQNVLSVPLQSVTVRRPNADKEGGAPGENKSPESQGTPAKPASTKDSKKPPSVVFLNDNNKAKMIKVETGISDNGYIEIVKGLDEGQTVISGNFRAVSKDLEDGTVIRVDTAGVKKMKK